MPYLPALSYHFHLSPPGVFDLTPEEIDLYLDALRAILAERE